MTTQVPNKNCITITQMTTDESENDYVRTKQELQNDCTSFKQELETTT